MAAKKGLLEVEFDGVSLCAVGTFNVDIGIFSGEFDGFSLLFGHFSEADDDSSSGRGTGVSGHDESVL